MLYVITTREMEVKTKWDSTSHTLAWLDSQRKTITRIEETGPSHTAGGNVKWFSHFGKQYNSPLKDYP
jgi:hypothetical protein